MERGRDGRRLGAALGSISSAVSSSAGSPALSISVLDSSTRVTSPCSSDEFDLVALGGGFAGEAPAQIVVHQLDIFRCDEIGQRLADHIRRRSCPSSARKRALANKMLLR